jgi:hypothetical protein
MDDIAAWSVTYDTDVTVKSIKYSSMTSSMNAPKVPTRIISVTDPNFEGEEFSFITWGSGTGVLSSITWNVRDKLFLVPMGNISENRDNYDANLLDYTISYIDAIKDNKKIPTVGSGRTAHIRGASFYYGEVRHPENVGDAYLGVIVTLEIEEYI